MSDISSSRLLVVNQLHPLAKDTNPGTKELPLQTIQAASDLAFPGNTILIHAGTYRETVIPPRGGEEGLPITYQAALDEKVSIKGSDRYVGKWQSHKGNGIYAATIPIGDEKNNPFAIPLVEKLPIYLKQMEDAARRRTLGQVFVDGQMFDEVDTIDHLETMPGSWMSLDGGKEILVHFPVWVTDPASHIVELTARKAVFRPEVRGLGYITIRGLILEHAANPSITSFWEKGFPPQQGLVSCRSGHHWVIENNVIRYAKSIGLDVGSEGRMDELDDQSTPGLVGYHRIEGNIISDNGQCGICGLGHIGTMILGNDLERNNSLGAIAWEEAAIKTHFYINGRIEGNLIRGNYCNGIWLDNIYQNVRVTRNVILNNQGAGIFCEMGGGPCLIDNNVIGLQTMGNSGIGGNGIYAHDAGGITIAHNFLCQNANFGVFMQIATQRNYAIYPVDIQTFDQKPVAEMPCHCRNQHIQNNIFVENHRGAVNLPYPSEKAGEMFCEHNLFCDWNGAGLFAVNTTAGAKLEDVMAVMKTIVISGLEDARCVPLVFGKHILIPLEAWRNAMNMDQESAIAEINNMHWQMIHPGPGAWLTFHINGKYACPALKQVDCDFYGNPIIEEQPAPGPFQMVKHAGAYHFRLWPIAGSTSTEPILRSDNVHHSFNSF
jgi:hypothetical protein